MFSDVAFECPCPQFIEKLRYFFVKIAAFHGKKRLALKKRPKAIIRFNATQVVTMCKSNNGS